MADRPAAETRVTDDDLRALLREQHPDLADLAVGARVEGWDCVTIRLGPRLAVRLPRRSQVAPLVEREQVWLPRLAAGLPVAVPAPIRVGAPSPVFPWPWSVVPWFDGEPAAATPRASRAAWAGALADVAVALHRPADPGAPTNPVRGVPLARRDADVRGWIAAGRVPEGDRVLTLWEAASSAPRWSGRPVWVHGDLHPANLLVRAGRLVAVLDFVDLAAGDPATDVATAWLTFDAGGRRSFRQRLSEAGAVGDDATWARAHGWAIVLAAAMLAHSDDDPAMAALGSEVLEQVLRDPPRGSAAPGRGRVSR
jgi:aminoglycoside phosphotransferase (APT) family kinase protein